MRAHSISRMQSHADEGHPEEAREMPSQMVTFGEIGRETATSMWRILAGGALEKVVEGISQLKRSCTVKTKRNEKVFGNRREKHKNEWRNIQ